MIQIEECIERLANGDEAERIYAAEDLGYANEAAGVDPLLVRLPVEPSRAVREAIVGALFQIEDRSVITGVIPWLDSDDAFLRNQAVEILRKRGAAAMPYMEEALRQGTADRRKFIIDVLARLGEADAASACAQALIDPDLNVVIAAVESLGDTGKAEFRTRIEELVSPGAHPMLLSACLEALALIADPRSVEAVTQRLGPAAAVPGYLRPSYLKLLGAAGRREHAAAMVAMIGQPGLAGPALNALTSLRNRYPDLELPASLAAPLREIVARVEPSLVGYQAVRLLAALPPQPEIFAFLDGSLQHSDKAIRIGAIQSLRELRTPEADAAVRCALASETDEEVLQAAGLRDIE